MDTQQPLCEQYQSRKHAIHRVKSLPLKDLPSHSSRGPRGFVAVGQRASAWLN